MILIFSDESGTWSNQEENYYIRSWISISSGEYTKLAKEVFYIQRTTGTKEIKWDNFKRNYQLYQDILSPGFKIFITLSIPKIFWESKNYKILTALQGLEDDNFTGDDTIKINSRKKIINSARAVIFLNYFEKQHIENSKVALAKDTTNYKYIVDTPQFLDKEWLEIAREVEINDGDIKIEKKSEEIPGIQIAGIVAGCFYDLLSKDETTCKDIFRRFLKSKMMDMYSSNMPNPNVIFYNDCPDDIKKKLISVRSL